MSKVSAGSVKVGKVNVDNNQSLSARYNVRAIPTLLFFKDGMLRVKFKDGQKDYALGAHPLWEIFRAAYQLTKSPFLIGGCALGLGYLLSTIRRVERPMSPELVRYRRADQMRRLRKLFKRMLFLGGSSGQTNTADAR